MRPIGLLAAAAALGAAPDARVHDVRAAIAQVDAGNLAPWKDREIKVSSRAAESVVTLALLPPAAPVILVFEVRRPGRRTDEPPSSIEMRAYLQPLADQRVQRRLDLQFTLDAGEGRTIPLDFFGTNWGMYGYVLAGDAIPVVRFTMAPSELKALAAARGITGAAMGFSFALRPDQLDALREFVKLVQLDDRIPPAVASARDPPDGATVYGCTTSTL